MEDRIDMKPQKPGFCMSFLFCLFLFCFGVFGWVLRRMGQDGTDHLIL